jgi:hypothetical protein
MILELKAQDMTQNLHFFFFRLRVLLYFSYFENKYKSRLMGSPLYLCLSDPPPNNFWMPERIFMKLGMYIMAPEHISMAYFINLSHRSVYLYVYPSVVARQRLGKNVTPATNTHATIELLNASFSMESVLY